METKAASTATVSFGAIQPYLKNSVMCPAGGTTFGNSYTLNGVSAKPICQILGIAKQADTTKAHMLPPDTTS